MGPILYAPMSAHDMGQCAGIGGNAADMETTLVAGLAIDRAFRLDHPEQAEIGPLLGRRETLQLGEHPAAPNLQSAVILLHRLGIGVKRVFPCLGLLDLEEGRDRFGQLGPVVLYRLNVIRLLGHVAVGSHGIDGDEGALEQQGFEQEDRDRRQFVRLLGTGFLRQEQLRLRGKGADPMQCLLPRHLAAPTGLAIIATTVPSARAWQNTAYPATGTLLHRAPIQQAKPVVGRNSAPELQKSPQPVNPFLGPRLDANKIINATEQLTAAYSNLCEIADDFGVCDAN